MGFTVPEASELLDMSVSHIERLCRAQRIPSSEDDDGTIVIEAHVITAILSAREEIGDHIRSHQRAEVLRRARPRRRR